MRYLFFGFIFCIVLFAQFFFKGKYLFPGSFIVSQYEPWKSEMGQGEAPTIVHKPLADDVFRQLYPMKKLAAEAFSKFQLPLWNPYNGAGQPLLATMHPGYLNPFSLILSLFPNGFGWTLYVFLQVPMLLIGMFLYMRILGVSRFGALISSMVLSLSGFVTVRLVYGDYVYALSFFVLLLASIEWYRSHEHHRASLIASALLTASIWFSTQPQIALYLLGFVFFYLIFCVYPKTLTRLSSRVRSDGVAIFYQRGWFYDTIKLRLIIFVALLLGTGIASIQLLPTLELYRLSVIDAGTSSFIIDRFLLPFTHFISLLIPNFFWQSGDVQLFWSGGFC